MEPAELAAVVNRLPGVDATAAQDGVRIHVSAIDDSAYLRASALRRFRDIRAPNGDPALEFVVEDAGEVWPFIVTPSDVVWAPASAAALLDSPLAFEITNAPPLVGYSEMEREARALADTPERSGDRNLSSLAATFLMARSFIVGAMRFDLRPVRSVGWWCQGWAAEGGDVGDLPLPMFRSDPRWDALLQESQTTPIPLPQNVDETATEVDVATLTVADFRAVEPRLAAVRLDEEFVIAWRAHIPATPAQVAQALLDGLDTAYATVALYPDGGRSVVMRVRTGDTLHALLKLRVAAGSDQLAIDEIRIAEAARGTGLFQRLMFNAEQLAELLRLSAITFLATDVGAYALARIGAYPRDPELYRRFGSGT